MISVRIKNVRLFAMLVVIALVWVSSGSFGQTCGFGCLGLGGVYGGYTVQKYDAKGLNEYIQAYNSSHSATLKEKMKEFGKSATGFRLGANIFRTRNNSLFFSLKGYYQYLREEHTSTEEISGSSFNTTYTLDLNYYGLGLDLGLVLGRNIDFKVIDAQVTFHSADFKPRTNLPDNQFSDIDFRNQKKIIGYTLGSGLIFHVIQNYISLEATAGYTKFAFEKLENDNVQKIENSFDSINDFVKNGGLSATVQLNVGIPLY
ncbi:MAG: hypothetical protein ACM34K_15825 [Bacillota bacterium]